MAQAQGNWEIASQNAIPNPSSVASSATINAEGFFTWTSNKSFLNDKHLARLNFALPTGVVVSSGTPSLSYIDNTPVQGVTFNMNTGGWTCEFAQGTVFAPGAKLVFRVSGLEIKDDQAYLNQQLTNFISFVSSPAAEDFTDNASTESFNTNVNGPLPVDVLKFNARLIDQNTTAKVQLNWETITEKNLSHFMIQRSTNSSDWKDLKEVKAVGNTNTNTKYEDFDNEPLLGTSYYRVMQFDENNDFVVSKVQTVHWNNDGQISLYPNPTSDILNVEFALETRALVEVKVLTAEGRVAKGIIKWSDKGLNKVELDIKELANGVYNVSVYKNNDLMSTGKVQKQ